MSEKKRSILLVDDDLVNSKILAKSLEQAGYSLITATNASEVYAVVENMIPDLILLDIVMPGEDGFEVCRRLKSQDQTKAVPIIFVSAIVDVESRLKAYELGGIDYILKPFYTREVVIRVSQHLDLIEAKRKLEATARSLESMVKDRTEQLIHADRMASLGLMSANVAHEIKTPVTFIKGNTFLLKEIEADLIEALEISAKSPEKKKKMEMIKAQLPKITRALATGAERITGLVQGLRAFSRQEKVEKEQVDLVSCLDDALALTAPELKTQVEVIRKVPSHVHLIQANSQQICQVFVNLIVNARQAMSKKKPGHLVVEVDDKDNQVAVRIKDDGEGMAPETVKKIWDPFFTTKPKDTGTGLGLSIVHGIIQDHKGRIDVHSEKGKGTAFTLLFPSLRKKK